MIPGLLTFFPLPDSPGMTSILRNSLFGACHHVQRDLLLQLVNIPYRDQMQSSELCVLTSGKHALHEVVDVAEYNSEALWSALLPHQRLDLNALQYWLRYGGIGILARVEYRSEEQREH